MPWYCWSLLGAAVFVGVVFFINRQPVPEDYEKDADA